MIWRIQPWYCSARSFSTRTVLMPFWLASVAAFDRTDSFAILRLVSGLRVLVSMALWDAAVLESEVDKGGVNLSLIKK
jgi:hypothetical protein